MNNKHLFYNACEWIAFNDNPGSSDALDAPSLEGMLTVCLVADVFRSSPKEVAEMVVVIRESQTHREKSNKTFNRLLALCGTIEKMKGRTK